MLLLQNVAAAQGLDVVGGSFSASVGGERVGNMIFLRDTVEFNVSVKSLFADECNVTIGLEVESVGPAWNDEILNRLVNGTALVSVRRFSFSPGETVNASLAWNTNDQVILKSGDPVRTQKGEFHIEFERDDCDGGGGPVAIALYSAPRNLNVTCPRDEIDFLGTCTPNAVVLAGVVGLIVAIVVATAVTRHRRRGRPPLPETPEVMPPT